MVARVTGHVGPRSGGGTPPDTVPARARDHRRERWLTFASIVLLALFTVVIQADTSDVSPVLLGLGAIAALLWQRRHLPAVTIVAGVFSLVALALYPQTVPGVIVADLVVVYLVSARAPRRVVWGVTVACAVLTGAMIYRSTQGLGRDEVQALVLAALMVSLVFGSWVLGQLRRARAQELLAVRERMRQVEVERAQAEQIAALTERTRLAREMHDIVAHAISGLVALADGGRYAAARDPDAAVRALTDISRGGRETLGELRGLIATLRDPTGPSAGPPPGTADIPDLVCSTAARGLGVELRTLGEPQPVPATVGLAAYRVVQEALTNVVKHAGLSARAEVTLDWRAGLTVEVRDDGRGLVRSRMPLGHGGAGLAGMRERVEALSGTLQAGPEQDGGYRVRARIPLPGASA